MPKQSCTISVEDSPWWHIETYSYAPGPTRPAQRHGHLEHQITWSSTFPGYYKISPTQKIEFGPRHLVLIPSWMAHSCHGIKDRDQSSSFVNWFIHPDSPIFEDIQFPNEALVQSTASKWNPDNAESLLFQLLNIGDDTIAIRETTQDFAKILDLIHQEPQRWMRTSDIAWILGYSARYIHRVIQSRTGMSPSQWIRSVKVDEAVRLLSAGTSVTQCAESLGFYDASHVRRSLLALRGYSTSHLKKKMSD